MINSSKHLGNMTKEELRLSYLQYKLMELDDMAQELGIDNDQDFDNALPIDVVQGDISNPKEWRLFKRSGNNGLYPLSRALFRNVHTGEVVKGMWNEQDGSKLLGEVLQ